MAKEELFAHLQNIFKDNKVFGWELMDQAAGLFEKLCIPGEAFPDDEIMQTSELDVEAAMWGFIISAHNQAEEGGISHHNYAQAIAVTLLATAKALEVKPEKVEEARKFEEITQCNPGDFITRFN